MQLDQLRVLCLGELAFKFFKMSCLGGGTLSVAISQRIASEHEEGVSSPRAAATSPPLSLTHTTHLACGAQAFAHELEVVIDCQHREEQRYGCCHKTVQDWSWLLERLLIPLLQGAAMSHWEAALTWRACFSYS